MERAVCAGRDAASVVDRLAAAATKAVASEELQAKIKSNGGDPIVMGPKEFADYLQNDIRRWSDAITGRRHQAAIGRQDRVVERERIRRTLADRQQVEDGYALVNAMWKTQGAAATLRYVHHLPHGRALPLGLDLSEIDRVIASCDSFYRGGYRDWPTQWFKAGDQYLERGRTALAGNHRETAAQMIFSAAACYHLAGYMHHDIGRLLPETRQSMLRAVEIYWEAAPLFSPPSIPLEIPYDDTTLRPFLRLPRGVERPPCVVLIGGANSNMINMHGVSEYYLARGMAALGLDGPGAGRILRAHRPAVARRGLRPGAERGGRLGRERTAGSTASVSASTAGRPARCWRCTRPR